MNSNQQRLEELKDELNQTYREMRQIFTRNNIPRRSVSQLPPPELKKWEGLNRKSTELITEFIGLIG